MIALMIVALVLTLSKKESSMEKMLWGFTSALALVVIVWRGPEARPDSYIGAFVAFVIIILSEVKGKKGNA